MKIAKSTSPMSGMMKLDTRANDLGDGGMPDLGNPPEGLQDWVRYRALHAGARSRPYATGQAWRASQSR